MANDLPPFRDLVQQVAESLSQLRSVLRTVLDRLMPDEYGARSFARSSGLELTSAWRCWTIAHVADPALALKAMPGKRAWRSILQRLEAIGATSDELRQARLAIDRFESIVADGRLDRTTLRALAGGGLESSRESAALLKARRANVRSAALLFGVHCRVQSTTILAAPGPRRHSVSIGYAFAFDRLSRTRPGMPWPILRQSVTVAADGPRGKIRTLQPLGNDSSLPSVLASLSTPGIVGAEIVSGRRHQWSTIELADVAVDRRRELHLYAAEVLPLAGEIAPGSILPFGSVDHVLLPCDLLIVELLVHRGLARHTDPASALYATGVAPESLASFSDATRLPLEIQTVPVAQPRLPARFGVFADGHLKAIARVAEAQGSLLADYEIFRILLPHPPTYSMLATTLELAGEPARPRRVRAATR
jgi:hypothetical protein